MFSFIMFWNLMLFVVTILIYNVNCEGCTLHYKPVPEVKTQLINRLSVLKSQRFSVGYGGSVYKVSICNEVSTNYPNVSALKKDKITTAIGRLNDTHISGGVDWILLTYAGGDVMNNSRHCHNSSMKTLVLLTCVTDSNENILELNEDETSPDCQVTFTIRTPILCSNIKKGMSKGTVFCVLLVTGSMMYLMVGVAYRRIMAGAQGLEQIPHYHFWRNLGNLQADGCDFFCRKGNDQEETWCRITNNFNDPADEPLLHP